MIYIQKANRDINFKDCKGLNSITTFMLHMEHISYNIINSLMKEENHIRGIAKELGINHMTISRMIKDLAKNNVVDFKKEGKNKKYFIKKTIEARSHVIMAEHSKLIDTLIIYPRLRKIVKEIQNDKRIGLAILFGSYAKQKVKKESDIDLYIKTKNTDIKKDISLLDSKLSIKIGEYNKENRLIKEIEKKHVIIKGVEKYIEENGFFD